MPQKNKQAKAESNSKSSVQEASFDSVLEELGPWGRYQVTQIALIMGLSFFNAFMNLSFVFLGYTPPHQCNKVNETELLSSYGLDVQNNSFQVEYKACDIQILSNETGKMKVLETLACPNGRTFTQYSTYIAYWDLVCESKGQAELTYTLFSAGRIPGGFIGAMLPDRYGRKFVIAMSALLACVFETVGIFSPNIHVLDALKFGSGFFYQAYSSSAFILMSELLVTRQRQIFSCILSIWWVMCCLLIGAMAYLLQPYDWQYFQATASSTFLVILFIQLFGKESPRWLAANNKKDEALTLLQFASKRNKKDFQRVKNSFVAYTTKMLADKNVDCELQPWSNEAKTDPINYNEDNNITENETNSKIPSIFTILRHKKILILIAMNLHIWLTHTLTYYGLFLTSTALAGNRFINFCLMALVEIPSALSLPTLDTKLGRRAMLILLLGITTLALLTSTLLVTFGNDTKTHTMQSISTAFFLFGKFAITASFSLIYTFTAELFPTNIRSTVLGFCSSVARLGSMSTPFLRPLIDIAVWAPGVIFTVMCGIALLLALLLPETKHKDMPNTLEEFLKRKNINKTSLKHSNRHTEES